MLLAFAAPLPAADMLYVTLSNNTIVSFDTTGNVGSTIAASVATFASTNLISPQGLAFDSSGNLYATNSSNNTISKFNSSGSFLTSWSTGAAAPIFLAFKPVSVPEPSTYALAAIATGVMAYLARRRKARTA
ncbi:MAG: PEP-CTERM sorting domain-containing protein [Planctomycetota bacterium]|nr:PEP-CTERM sorting domain-containing protein [Planctomycetota bacterium]